MNTKTRMRIIKENAKARKMGISYGFYKAMTRPRPALNLANIPKTPKNQARIRELEEIEKIKKKLKENAFNSPAVKLVGSGLAKYEALEEWEAVCAPLRARIIEEWKRRAEK